MTYDLIRINTVGKEEVIFSDVAYEFTLNHILLNRIGSCYYFDNETAEGHSIIHDMSRYGKVEEAAVSVWFDWDKYTAHTEWFIIIEHNPNLVLYNPDFDYIKRNNEVS